MLTFILHNSCILVIDMCDEYWGLKKTWRRSGTKLQKADNFVWRYSVGMAGNSDWRNDIQRYIREATAAERKLLNLVRVVEGRKLNVCCFLACHLAILFKLVTMSTQISAMWIKQIGSPSRIPLPNRRKNRGRVRLGDLPRRSSSALL